MCLSFMSALFNMFKAIEHLQYLRTVCFSALNKSPNYVNYRIIAFLCQKFNYVKSLMLFFHFQDIEKGLLKNHGI